MFAVGVNSSEKDFLKAFKRPTSVLAGYTGQFLVKPLLGYVFGFIAVAIFGLPTPVGFVSKYVMLFGHFCLHYLCVGAPLAINIEPAMSPFGLTVLLLFIACYLTAFIAGCFLTGVVFHTTPDVKALQRTLSYETDCDHVFDGLLPRHGLRKKERTMTKRISIVESWFDGLQHMDNFFYFYRNVWRTTTEV
ncbi:hypothetical protein DVH24_001297 [Malus domestica]|uniref:Uncharacterized protein n=1 Tax=Malus domestica TaxID=3750 RepID=A0A498K5U8_MALDO|nr:hypothetical protein DVH24_001297 [Malus domestica]